MAARYTAIVIAIWKKLPAFTALACNIGLTGFSLSIQRVEVLLEPVL
jgi:hypothetical protein